MQRCNTAIFIFLNLFNNNAIKQKHARTHTLTHAAENKKINKTTFNVIQ